MAGMPIIPAGTSPGGRLALIQAMMAPGAPAPQTAIAPTDVEGAYGLTQNALDTAYQGKLAAANSRNTAGAGLAGSALTAAAIW